MVTSPTLRFFTKRSFEFSFFLASLLSLCPTSVASGEMKMPKKFKEIKFILRTLCLLNPAFCFYLYNSVPSPCLLPCEADWGLSWKADTLRICDIHNT